jgi:hypothetical protein
MKAKSRLVIAIRDTKGFLDRRKMEGKTKKNWKSEKNQINC